jgi:hypothetical protein
LPQNKEKDPKGHRPKGEDGDNLGRQDFWQIVLGESPRLDGRQFTFSNKPVQFPERDVRGPSGKEGAEGNVRGQSGKEGIEGNDTIDEEKRRGERKGREEFFRMAREMGFS